MKPVEIADENGKSWLIYKGDLAWNLCQLLAKAGVFEVVLPRQTLLQGTLPPPDSIDIPDVPIESVRMSTDVQTIMRRQIRLKDCVQWLAMNGVAS